MVFDMATASMAKGEVMIAARDGHIFSVGVWWDENVNPSNGPKEILKGVLLTFGGYKSDGIALMVKLFAAGLTGDFFLIKRKRMIMVMVPVQKGGGIVYYSHKSRNYSGYWLEEALWNVFWKIIIIWWS
mgnify:CR=1 FL=1